MGCSWHPYYGYLDKNQFLKHNKNEPRLYSYARSYFYLCYIRNPPNKLNSDGNDIKRILEENHMERTGIAKMAVRMVGYYGTPLILKDRLSLQKSFINDGLNLPGTYDTSKIVRTDFFEEKNYTLYVGYKKAADIRKYNRWYKKGVFFLVGGYLERDNERIFTSSDDLYTFKPNYLDSLVQLKDYLFIEYP